MAKSKKPKKIVTAQKSESQPERTKKVVTQQARSEQSNKAQSSRAASREAMAANNTLLFGRQNYLLMLAGIASIALGMLLMLGGFNEDPNTWDEGLIYSTRRTLIAPFFILLGLVIEFFAIFKK